MKILPGRQLRNFKEAAVLAFREAGVGDMSAGVTDLFISFADADRLRTEAEKSIGAALRDKYRDKPKWQRKWWCIPVPILSYEARDIPQLKIRIETYLLAVAEVETTGGSHLVTLVGITGKPETLVIPMVFLHAVLNDDVVRFGISARSGSHTTWEIPGAKALQLPNDFVNKLTGISKRKSMGMWLNDFGTQGRSIKPLVVGSLLGLQFQSTTEDIPLAQQPYTPERLVTALEAMAYTGAEAEVIVGRASPGLRADHTLEEALRIVLQYAGKGE